MYSQVSENDGGARHRRDEDSASVASSKRRFRRQRVNSDLSEPLTSSITSVPVDEEMGNEAGDPFFVFRGDLKKKLEFVDESLIEFLRVVNETVSSQ